MTDKTYNWIIIGGLLFSFIICLVLTQLTKTCIEWQNQALLYVLGFTGILVLFVFVASSTSFRRKFPALSSALPPAVMIYFGFLIISLAFYKELLKQMPWDPTMVALGIAVLAFGWTFVTQHLQDKKIDKIEKMVSKLQPTKTRGRKQGK
jgi:glucan phosphoethanolaminetransferase (alkaline phosphatase superfamily)